MMNACKEFKDLILTDYIDGELDQGTQERVESHLRECPECRAFADETRKNLFKPFAQAGREVVPAHVWLSVKEKIEIEKEKRLDYKVKGFIAKVMESFSFPRLAPVLTSLVFLIVIGSAVFRGQYVKQMKNQEQGEYLFYLLGSAGSSSETESNGLTTAIEQYFL